MLESNLIFYTTPNGQVSVQVQYEDGSFWLTQKRMAELFGVESHTITYHLKEIYQSGELQVDSITRKIRVVQQEGKREVQRNIANYNMDTIILSDYRVKSLAAMQFRKWVVQRCKQVIIETNKKKVIVVKN